MKTIKHITRIQEEKLSEAGRHRLQLAKNHLRDAVRICKLRYPELLLPLETIQFIPVKESIRLSTDGLHIFYDPEFVIRSSSPTGENGMRDAEAEPTVSEFLLHILFHGLLGHFETKKDHMADPQLAWAMMDLQTELVRSAVFPPSPKTASSPNPFSRPVAEGANVNVPSCMRELSRASAFPHALYMKCLSNKLTATNIKMTGSLKELDNHSLWYLPENNASGQNSPTGAPNQNGTTGASGHDSAPDSNSLSAEIHRFWSSARSFIQSSGQAKQKGLLWAKPHNSEEHGTMPGNTEMTVTQAKGPGMDYTEMLREFYHIAEDRSEDPESIDAMLYLYGLDLYEDVPLIEPADETHSLKMDTLPIAIDTSGSCSGGTASLFLRETRKLLSDIEQTGSFREVILLTCDAAITGEYHFTSAEAFSSIDSRLRLAGFGGTDFRPVFKYAEKYSMQNRTVDALIYLTDSYGTFPRKTPVDRSTGEALRTYFVMEAEHFNGKTGKPDNRSLPSWITPVRIRETT